MTLSDLLFALGLIVVIFTGASVLFTIVLPREPAGFQRVSTFVLRVVQLAFIGFSRSPGATRGRMRCWHRPHRWRSWPSWHSGPAVSSLDSPSCWRGRPIISSRRWPRPPARSSRSGQSTSVGGPTEAVDIAAGATWVVIVALQIAYLPALYQAFNRRESLVAMLESRAGVPAWGPEVLARHQLVGIIDTLPEFYSSWEGWSAELAESHTTYPVMLLFRSPDPWFSWLVGLLAVLDGAAMHLALAPGTASSQSRLCLRMGFTALNRVAKVLRWEVDPDPDPEGDIDLTFEEFAKQHAMLEKVGFPLERSAEEAWPDFRGWRVNYETVAYRLCDRLTAPPAPWSGSRRHFAPVWWRPAGRHSEPRDFSISVGLRCSFHRLAAERTRMRGDEGRHGEGLGLVHLAQRDRYSLHEQRDSAVFTCPRSPKRRHSGPRLCAMPRKQTRAETIVEAAIDSIEEATAAVGSKVHHGLAMLRQP